MTKQEKRLYLGVCTALIAAVLALMIAVQAEREKSLNVTAQWALSPDRTGVPMAEDPRLEALRAVYQKQADEAPWTWSDSQANLECSIACYAKDYNAHFFEESTPWKPLRIRIWPRDGHGEGYTWVGHQGTVFARWEHTLFVADFGPIRAGCRIMAVDLQTGRQLWKTNLKATSCPGHSMYRNQVNIETDGKVVTVRGNESYGRYIEFVDCQTGKTVGHKEYPRE
jgi:hypothetical protein